MECKEKLISLRDEQGLSQQEFADKLGVTRQTVSKWESGKIKPGADNLVAMSRLFGVSTDYILNLSPQSASQEEAMGQPERTEQEEEASAPEHAEQEGGGTQPERAEQEEAIGTPEPSEPEGAQRVLRKRRFLRRLAATGAGVGILMIGIYIGAKFSPNSARDAIPANALPPDGTYTVNISTEDGDYVIQYEKHRIVWQDEIEPEEINPEMIEDYSDGWIPLED